MRAPAKTNMEQVMRKTLLLCSLVLVASGAMAATPPAAETGDVPKPTCTKPGEFPGRLASERQSRQFQKDYVAFTDCLRKFALEQQKLAEPHIKASNDAINDYNDAVKRYNDYAEKMKEERK
jgi:hypothetical protein